MSADRLREAARVLREQAEAATPPGHTHPWRYTEATYGDPTDGPTHVAAVCCGANGVQPGHFIVAEEGATATADIVTYIATMHPGVGLHLVKVLWLLDSAGLTDDAATVGLVDAILGGAS